MVASFKPAVEATELPATLYENWSRELAAGARAALHAMPGQSFTDVAAAQVENAEFAMGVQSASSQATTGAARSQLRVRAHPLF